MHKRVMPPSLRIGLSGWNYDDWKTGFYQGVPRRRWLEHYAGHFDCVEVNATFYGTIRPATFAAWRATVPEGFGFAVKGHQFVTHRKRLLDPDDTLPRQAATAEALGPSLSAMLWQLPAAFKPDAQRLELFCQALARHLPGVRHVFEPRHEGWFTRETAEILRRHGVTPCISDAGDWPRWDAVGERMAYVRLHGSPETYFSPYSNEELHSWARRCRDWLAQGLEVHVYFDNTAEGHAVTDALRLREMMEG